MRCIIAGGRTICDYGTVSAAIDASGFSHEITEVVCGGARGVDFSGACWAESNHVPVVHFPADWYKHGLSAGPKRNKEMAEYADALILVWDGKSKGSANMLKQATARGLKIYQHVIAQGAA